MSWAEIKKAVNSNLDVPLNEQLDEQLDMIKNDLFTINLSDYIDQNYGPPVSSGALTKEGWVFDINAPMIVYLMNISHNYSSNVDSHIDTLYIDDEVIPMETNNKPMQNDYKLKSIDQVSSIIPIMTTTNVFVNYFRYGNSNIIDSISPNINYEQYQSVEDWKASFPLQNTNVHNVLLSEPIICRNRFALYSKCTGTVARTNVRLVYRLLENSSHNSLTN